MQALYWPSIGFYCLFGVFLFYQQLHGRNFRGGSAAFGLALNASAAIGTVVGLFYLVYYGWNVAWWAAIVIFFVGVAAAMAGFVVEKAVGALAISMAGFVGWPVCAYFMFRYIPSGA